MELPFYMFWLNLEMLYSKDCCKTPSNLRWITTVKIRIDWEPAGKAWPRLQKKTTSTSSPSSPFFTSMENVMLEICEERK